jgi:uncharacterized protein GlcG (DUF336 family)
MAFATDLPGDSSTAGRPISSSGMRTADLLPLVQPGQPLFPLMSQDKYCAMGGGAPLTSEGRVIAGVGVSGGTVEQDVAILEAGLREA